MERWRDGEVERWRDGGMERWRDGGMEVMEGWRGGEMKETRSVLGFNLTIIFHITIAS
jgi:hypothetical protein